MNNSFGTSHYTEVEPFVGENFNYHELGIVAATEMAANNNAFMKAIALSELAAVEQTGSTDVLYESVDIKGIFEKIKMFFKKIIEKIHKIFHTFIAKMSSWFGGNAGFAKKYEKEVIKGWANVKNDWEFKGYDYSKALKTKKESADLKATTTKDAGDKISKLLNGDLEAFVKGHGKVDDGSGTNKNEDMTANGNLAKYREKMDDIKQGIRKQIIDELSKDAPAIPNDFNIILDASSGLEQSEFTEELFKVFRGGEDSKQDLKKDAITSAYGGSVTAMMTFIKDFDTIKKNLEKSEKNITDGIEKLIKAMDKAENDLLKDKANKAANEPVVQASSFYQSIWGAISEMVTQTFSALIQANKDACVQAKEIAVKVIGQGKSMTEESYDYSSNADGLDFISSVKLI